MVYNERHSLLPTAYESIAIRINDRPNKKDKYPKDRKRVHVKLNNYKKVYQ